MSKKFHMIFLHFINQGELSENVKCESVQEHASQYQVLYNI